jgi:Xaa-Pro aminopeptidase
MEAVAGAIRPGVSEKDVKNGVIDFLQAAGAEGPSFDIIVASGANSAMPHATATDKKIEAGDFVLVDLGCVIDGYCSDITRTFCVGSADEAHKKMYRAAAGAHAEALEMLKAGARAAEIDEVCRASLERGMEGARFLHSLGHGVGLEIHEAPYIGSGSTDSLEKGMVFTIEPGLYRSGFGGVRIEDMVLLNDTPELLTGYSRELIEL